jgi:uncharacterized protein YuzE
MMSEEVKLREGKSRYLIVNQECQDIIKKLTGEPKQVKYKIGEEVNFGDRIKMALDENGVLAIQIYDGEEHVRVSLNGLGVLEFLRSFYDN